MNESSHKGDDTDEPTGRELWQIRPVGALAGASSRVRTSFTQELSNFDVSSDSATEGAA